jgi:hypothetical protein
MTLLDGNGPSLLMQQRDESAARRSADRFYDAMVDMLTPGFVGGLIADLCKQIRYEMDDDIDCPIDQYDMVRQYLRERLK